MKVKTSAEIAAALVFVVSENNKLNEGQPKNSLHAAGHCLPTCNLCSVERSLRWVLGEPDPMTGQPVEFPYVTESERENLLRLADMRANIKLPACTKVNDW